MSPAQRRFAFEAAVSLVVVIVAIAASAGGFLWAHGMDPAGSGLMAAARVCFMAAFGLGTLLCVAVLVALAGVIGERWPS